jgi:hypothetical protein
LVTIRGFPLRLMYRGLKNLDRSSRCYSLREPEQLTSYPQMRPSKPEDRIVEVPAYLDGALVEEFFRIIEP